jgi:predicted cupin superfamily sugar epimerase
MHEPSAEQMVEALGLVPHPEGGFYRETWREPAPDGGRARATSILYLLRAGERSAWHVVDARELWCFHAGAALELSLWPEGAPAVERVVLGGDACHGQRPQVLIAPGCWQAARPLGAWTLVAAVVVPGFEFAGFRLAPPGWEPPAPLPARG